MANPGVIPGVAAPAGPPPTQSSGLMRVVTPATLDQWERDQTAARLAAEQGKSEEQTMDALAAHVRSEFDMMRNHRNSAAGWNNRLLNAVRVFNGEYDATKLAEIRQFGGSEIYSRTIALKCRSASALLREVYLGIDRPWGLEPTPTPTLPDNVIDAAQRLVQLEIQGMMAGGEMPTPLQIRDRTNALMEEARRAAKENAKDEAKEAEDKLDDLLVEGGFYDALMEFITDLPLFPFACIKGPVVRVIEDIKWEKGQPVQMKTAKMFWERKSPFDIWWTPGVARIRDAAVCERLRLTRADLNDLLGLPGYNEDNIRKVLDDFGRGGLVDWMDSTDSERATGESRENPNMNRSALIDCLEYHGNVQGRTLHEYGFTRDEVPDELRDYFVQVWLIGRYVIKAQISPNPRKRHPYHITSFEKVPGTPVGNALPDILTDIGEAANNALRALMNNLSISSGPQVVIDDTRMQSNEDGDDLYPWKRWHTVQDPLAPNQSNTVPPVSFFQPQSNAQELLGVYTALTNIADEVSAIPKYITGSDKLGGAGRTASGLAMLMGNASKVLQMVASNVDRDVMQEILESLYDMVMLTDQSGTFRGDETIRVRGVEVAVQRETARQRQIEFLTATANPIDFQIVGPEGRAKVLREVSKSVGIEGDIVPDDKTLRSKMQPPPGAMLPPGVNPEGGAPDGTVLPPANNTPAPANTDLGVQDAGAMRGMA